MNDCSIDFRVRYAETDQMKFAHHSVYIVWFEMARLELLRRMGISYAQMEKEGYLLPVIEVRARYFKPAFFDEKLRIKAQFGNIEKAHLRIDYRVEREGIVICEGYSVHAFTNAEGKPIRPPKFFLDKVLK